MRRNAPIVILLLAYLGLAALYGAAVPLGEGPDEPGHARYVFFLAREGRLPVQCAAPCESDVPGEGHQPPLAYLLAAPAALWLPPDERRLDQPGNPRFTWAGGGEVNAVAHGSRERWPWRGPVLAWRLARLASTLCGAATVLLTYLAARALSARQGEGLSAVPLLAALLVALNPQFLFISGLVTNDALLAALSAALLWLVVGGQPSAGRALAIGVALGLALLTKQSALLLAPVALLWCLLKNAGAHSSPPRDDRPGPLARLLIVFGAAAIIAGWWYARNWQLYGDPLGAGIFQAEFATQRFEAGSWQAWAGALAQLHASFWARFGWMNVAPPGWAIGLYALIELAAVVGLTRLLRRPGLWASSAPVGGCWPLIALPLLAFAWVTSFALTAGLVAWQGRLLFPALPALAIVLASGLAAWDPAAAGRRLATVAAGGLAALALWMPFGAILPAYPPQALPEAEALAQIAAPVYGRFARSTEPGAELRSALLEGSPAPGAALELTLLWHALGPQDRAWTVFIHLVDDSEEILAEDNAEPRGGAFPMSQWVAGDWVSDTHELRLPADIAPGAYELRVGLYYPPTDRRAGVWNEKGKLLGDYLVVGEVVIK